MSSVYVHTVAGSTIDNLFCLLDPSNPQLKPAKEQSVEGILERELNDSESARRTYKVVSHAFAGFTTESVLHGDQIGKVLPSQAQERKRVYLEEKEQGTVRPLERLQAAIQDAPDATHYVVISLGGDDFRKKLGNPIALFHDIPQVQQRYLQILDRVQNLKGRDIRPILMFQYPPEVNYEEGDIQLEVGLTELLQLNLRCKPLRGVNSECDMIYQPLRLLGRLAVIIQLLALTTLAITAFAAFKGKIGYNATLISTALAGIALYNSEKIVPLSATCDMIWKKQQVGLTVLRVQMERFYQPILQRAIRDNLPILDLPNSFNPHAALYYSGIEPNQDGGKWIAKGIAQIVKSYPIPGREPRASLFRQYVSNPKLIGQYTSSPLYSAADWKVLYPEA